MQRSSWSASVFLVGVALISSMSVAAAELSRRVRFDIPAQSLQQALFRFTDQTGVQVVVSSELLSDKTSTDVSGELPIQQGLLTLLDGTQLEFSVVNPRTVALRALHAGKAKALSQAISVEHALDEGSARSLRLAQDVSQAEAATESSQDGDRQAAAREVANTIPLEEIIVTATKRAERIQDIPLSVTAIGNAEIESRGLRGMDDYLAAVPGVSFIATDGSNNAIVIRGIDTGPEAQNFSAGTTVASYFGETSITNSAGLKGGSGVDIKLVDIDRIEILRGPQGTAFGNSSLGGAVRTIPMAPRLDRISGKLAAEYSYTDREGSDNNSVEGVFNLPLITNQLAIRAVGYKYQWSGYYSNVAGTEPLMQEYAAALGPQALSLATNADDRGRVMQMGGRFAMLWQPSDALRLTLSYLHQKSEQTGDSASFGLGDGYSYVAFRILPSRGLRGSEDSVLDTRIDLVNALLEYDLGWADLVASASWLDSETQQVLGASYERPYDYRTASPHENFSSEVRLVSRLDGPWSFLAGIYHENMDDFSRETYASLEIPELNPYGDGVNEVLGIWDDTRKLRQNAVFAEVSYDLLSNLTLTVGGRYYKYERDNALAASGWFAGTELDAPDVSVLEMEQSGESLKANLSYKPSNNSLLYASWAEGFRLGRPAAGLIPAICDTDSDGIVDGTGITIESTRSIDSDNLDNYEIGGKFTLLGGRLTLDTAVYNIKWTGLPTNARVMCGADGYSYVSNAGEARSRGVELQMSYQPGGGIRVSFGASYTDAELRTDNEDLGAFSGDRLPGSPQWIANLGLQYDFNLAGRAAFIRADSAYRGEFYSDFLQSPTARSGGYVLLDARAGIRFDRVNVELFVDNLTDVDDFIWRGLDNTEGGFGYIMRPRTLGMRLGYSF